MTSICITLQHTAFVPTLQLWCISAAEKGLVVETGTDSARAEGYLQRCVGNPYSLLTHIVPGSNLRFLHSACLNAEIPPNVNIQIYASKRDRVHSVHMQLEQKT